MHTLTVEDVARQPQRLLDDAARGEPSLVTRSGEPVLLAVPLAAELDPSEVRLELAARLYDCGQISLGTAARIRDAVGNGWLVLCDASPITSTELQLGERAAIGRAIEIGAGLLADDASARRHGLAGGLAVIGALGVLVLAKRATSGGQQRSLKIRQEFSMPAGRKSCWQKTELNQLDRVGAFPTGVGGLGSQTRADLKLFPVRHCSSLYTSHIPFGVLLCRPLVTRCS